eukprot:CAMPEP_0183720526 /NCGR_PEP_ID=MMETSP0737-20130205/13118_1 /TAXON_ID=385413 /ORGANISM="Thalassiosira miniscula, Strain CCMP1093" /LENGTH=217 /DNA_ID=CAMNT_0025950401 /DNA_START=147 /DNA_END=800 /DNA_ORIENTATION=+
MSSAHNESLPAEEGEVEDLEKLQAEIARMEAEAARIAKETEDLEKEKLLSNRTASAPDSGPGKGKSDSGLVVLSEKSKKDGHSIYVGQVDYSSTPEELLAHFESCGTVERVTIVCDKYSGRPKGFAYLEFQTATAVENALKLDGSSFKDRNLKVTPKRINDPNYYLLPSGGYQGRGRSFRGSVRGGRGGFGRGGPGRGRSSGRGRGLKIRGRGFQPY